MNKVIEIILNILTLGMRKVREERRKEVQPEVKIAEGRIRKLKKRIEDAKE